LSEAPSQLPLIDGLFLIVQYLLERLAHRLQFSLNVRHLMDVNLRALGEQPDLFAQHVEPRNHPS